MGFDNAGVREWIDSARAQSDAAGALPYWKRAGDAIAGQYPYAFLWFFDLIVAVGPRIEGVEADVVGFAHGLHRWGLAAGAGERTDSVVGSALPID